MSGDEVPRDKPALPPDKRPGAEVSKTGTAAPGTAAPAEQNAALLPSACPPIEGSDIGLRKQEADVSADHTRPDTSLHLIWQVLRNTKMLIHLILLIAAVAGAVFLINKSGPAGWIATAITVLGTATATTAVGIAKKKK